jgi:hypothetical protein
MSKLPRFNAPRNRKGPKRVPAKAPKIDPELAQIAQLLDEHRLETNATGWFKLPWRNGYFATALALEVFDCAAERDAITIPSALSDARHHIQKMTYEELDDLRHGMPIYHFLSRYIRGAIRCRQLLLSKSDGGGYGYNDVLRVAVGDHVGEEQMIEWRARDALNVLPADRSTQAWESARKTFELAWKRGLYHAAYAIKPVGD